MPKLIDKLQKKGGKKMSVNSVNSQKTIDQIIEQTTGSKKSKRNTGELGKDEFINLLVTQLQYQDPLNPQDDTQFIAQMAQFSALEQMQNLNTSYAATKAFGMIGKVVTANLSNDAGGTNSIVGEVTSVKMQSGKAYVVVNGNDVPVDNVMEVSNIANDYNLSNLANYTGLIGYNCQGFVYDSDTQSLARVNGVVKQVIKGAYENYAVMNDVEVNVIGVNSSYKSTNPSYIENYLANNKGQEVSIVVAGESGAEVPVKAILKDYSVAPNGRINAVLDEVKVPVDSIVGIKANTVKSDVGESSDVVEAVTNDEE